MRDWKNYICKDLASVENYDEAAADGFNGWHLHHRLETHTSDGERRPMNAQISQKELKALGMYYDRPANELIFLRTAEHLQLHHLGKRKEKVADPWYAANRDRQCEWQREYDRAHRDRKRSYMREYMRLYNQRKNEHSFCEEQRQKLSKLMGWE